MAKIIKTGGQIIVVNAENYHYFTENELTNIVGGEYQLHDLANGKMVVNKQGKSLGLRRNEVASAILEIDIYGDVLLCYEEELKSFS